MSYGMWVWDPGKTACSSEQCSLKVLGPEKGWESFLLVSLIDHSGVSSIEQELKIRNFFPFLLDCSDPILWGN